VIQYLSLFSGIGAFESAFRNLQIPFELINYCEIEPSPAKAYSLIHNIPESKNLGDITKIDESKLGSVDFITYGFPCQDISRAGQQKGFTDEDGNKTRSGLFFDAARIIKATQPKIAIAENVKPLVQSKFKEEFKTVLEELELAGYNNYWKVLKASDYGVPQSRERVFIVSIRKDLDNHIFEFPSPYQLEKCMMDYLEKDVEQSYFLSDKMMAYVLDLEEKQAGTKWEGRANNDFINPIIAHTLSVRGIKGQRAGVSNVISVRDPSPIKVIDYKKLLGENRTNDDLRNLTERESFRLMGFKDSEFDRIKDHFKQTELYTMAGNSIVVDVAEELLCMIFDSENEIYV
jgi:DNA (cytosine-5)-methyltransferase 1